jgi:hypothetical protein
MVLYGTLKFLYGTLKVLYGTRKVLYGTRKVSSFLTEPFFGVRNLKKGSGRVGSEGG